MIEIHLENGLVQKRFTAKDNNLLVIRNNFSGGTG